MLVVAEAPGETEAALGEPLVGTAGSWLRGRIGDRGERIGGLLWKAGVRDADVTFANVLCCRPPENVFPTDAAARSYCSKEEGENAVAQCKKTYLDPLLNGRPWSRINLLGEKALRLVAGKEGGINRWRGSPLVVEGLNGGKPIAVATLHPSYIARDQTMIPAVISDLKKSLQTPPEFYKPLPSLDEVRAFTATTFAFDIETPQYRNLGDAAPIEMVGLSARAFHAICVPFAGEYKRELIRIFANAQEIVGHNCISFDLPRLEKEGVVPPASVAVWDTMLMHHLLSPQYSAEAKDKDEFTKGKGGGGHGLGFVGSIYTSKPAWKHEAEQDIALYCCRDVDVTFQIWLQLKPLLRKERLTNLYQNVQVPLARIARLMHTTGIALNPNRIHEVRERLLEEYARHEQTLPEFLQTVRVPIKKRQPAPEGTLSPKTGKPLKFVMVEDFKEVVPWRQNGTVATWLYETLRLPVQTNLDSGNVTTAKQAVELLVRQLKRENRDTEVRQLTALQRLRQLDELLSTFCKAEMQEVERIHPSFNPHGTSSGRWSSSDPNMQNIPSVARYMYVPTYSDWEIADIDYSQIENRLTAYFAQDTERMGRFLRDADFSEHKFAASQFFSIPYGEVLKDNDKEAPYGKAKRIVHGSNYGMGAVKIAKMYDMPLGEVRELLAKWKAAIRPTTEWQERCAAQAKRDGSLTTPFGRRRWFYTQSYFTEALSFLPQSTAADIIFRAMLGMMWQRIGWPLEKVLPLVPIAKPLPTTARLLLQVHDSLVFEYPRAQRDEVLACVSAVMTQPWQELGGLSIPIGIAVGPSWGECEKVVL